MDNGPGGVACAPATVGSIITAITATRTANARRTAWGAVFPSAWQAPVMPQNEVVLVRHGETEWARLGRHTGRTDIPLTEQGRSQAELAGRRLVGRTFGLVLTSALSRASETCRLAGFADQCELTDDLLEWDYGEYEGRRTADIRIERPGWTLWDDGVPGGETAAAVGPRGGPSDRPRPRGRRRCAAVRPWASLESPRRPMART